MTSDATPPPASGARSLMLASRSPRRRKLLEDAGYHFDVDPAGIDEDDFPPASLPIDLAIQLARKKAVAIAAKYPDRVVLAADTVVASGDQIIGQPDDAAHAREILRLLTGAVHIVVTGVAVVIDSIHHVKTARVLSSVRIRRFTERELEKYLLGGLWRGKAGGYGLQDDSGLVDRVVGCETNVIGLPMTTTRAMLAEVGIVPTITK